MRLAQLVISRHMSDPGGVAQHVARRLPEAAHNRLRYRRSLAVELCVGGDPWSSFSSTVRPLCRTYELLGIRSWPEPDLHGSFGLFFVPQLLMYRFVFLIFFGIFIWVILLQLLLAVAVYNQCVRAL